MMTSDELLTVLAPTSIKRPPVPGEYDRFDTWTAGKMAVLLTSAAASSGVWQHLPEHLAALRDRAAPRRDFAADLAAALNT